jgi:hypothetical protein
MQEVGRTSFRTRSGKIWIGRPLSMKYNKPSQLKMETVFFLMLSLICLMAKKMIVDSKISDSLRNTLMREDDILKNKLFKEHVNSIKRHVEQLKLS